MKDFPICPLCKKPVNTNSEAHIIEKSGETRHHECPVEEAPAADPE